MALFHVAAAEAQLNNRPFSFGGGGGFSGGGGIGMSTAGRQAILNQQLFGSTPDNILRSRFGLTLLNVTRGDNGLAVAPHDPGRRDHSPIPRPQSKARRPVFRID